MKPLAIIGDSSFAEIAQLYFERDTNYTPVVHVVDDAYQKREKVGRLPVIGKSAFVENFDPSTTYFYAALVYSGMNQLRQRFLTELETLGYTSASYISPRAYVDSTAVLGRHIFIFEHNVIQPFTSVESNAILWSGNHIGHHSTVGANVFVSSHVVISGHCKIGNNSFLGVNSSVANNVNLGSYNWISPGVCILKDTNDDELWVGSRPTLHHEKPSIKFSLPELV